MKPSGTLAPRLEAFFTERLQQQRQASPHTIAAYRDTFTLLLRYAKQKLSKDPSAVMLADVDASFVASFLDHLEKERGNSARTRNARLAAIHSFFHYASFHEPEISALIQRVLAIPSKRCDHKVVGFLSRPEVDAILTAPNRSTWFGRRDHALLFVMIQTGLRVSELTGLRCSDLSLGTGAHLRCRGKGRKERCVPLTKQAAALLRAWLRERRPHPPDAPLFPTRQGASLSSDAVAFLLAKYARVAAKRTPSLTRRRVTPHVLRHTTAVHLLQAGVDRTVIALWLGHESVETTQIYVDADLTVREQALAKTALGKATARRFRPDDGLLAFLNGL